MNAMISNLFKILAVILLAMMLQGCLDIYFTTEVHQNGSITKTIVFEGDSSEIISQHFPFLNDETWDRQWLDGDDDKKKLVLSKDFKSARKAAKELNPADSIPQIRIQPVLKKKFRWFFSYLEYKDILLATNPFQKIDWRDYLSKEEILLIPMDEDDRENHPLYKDLEFNSTEDRFENYLYDSGYEEFWQLFILSVNNTDGSTFNQELLQQVRLPIFEELKNSDNDISTSEDLLHAFKLFLDPETIDRVFKQNLETFEYFTTKMDYFNEAMDDNYRFVIRMPGLLVNTNSNEIEGNSLSWEIDYFEAFFEDYEMIAESRIVNIWAFIVTGLAIAFLLFGMIWKLFRKKKA
ncbi:MAG: hypothetical protein HN352_10225 [Bacteroidetes bacterium]|jgi:hypothetical protein|nr:hypothetical protein [Bacteroidota bacterium]MBT3749306.1 hypothetical protein [Bacteroidota bacterium]MBT4401438.1 hypothetical protein [Bacteroidota bacterium]MBT4410097.1 hypothetical protein [Bacteroidota bacterium]MBT5426608.1 hypothetical protein [Bacteroidota bacterium]